MKKIGLLISELNKGGAERVVSRLTYILSGQYHVYLILFEDTFIEYDYSAELINLDVKSSSGIFKIISLLRRAKRLKRIKKELELNYVISFMDSPNIVNILSKTKDCKIGISIRNYSKIENSRSFISKIVNKCIKFLYNKADVVIAVSKVIAESMVKDYGVQRNKLKVIYNPFDVEHIQQFAMEELEPQYRDFINKETTFISVGRQMYQKGYWHLIKAFKLVHDKNKAARLIIVGKDYHNGKCQKLIDDFQLNESVLLVGQHRNPFKFIKASTVYVLTSLFEGFPNSMVEAMACGCPIIAADCKSGPREILCDHPQIDTVCSDIETTDNGILIPPLESEENWDSSVITSGEKKLAESMIMMIEDEEIRLHYGQKALERAKYFSYERCKKAFCEIIDID